MSLDLPTELFWNVLTYLEDPEVAKIRSLCKSFDEKCLDPFGRRHFRVKQFMLSAEGLQALCDLANGRLGRFLRTLRVGSEALVCAKTGARENNERFRELCESQIFFRLRGLDTALLTVALRALRGTLQEIIVSGSHNKSGYRSWGAKKLEDETGTKLVHEQTRTLSTTLAAIAVSQIRLQSFRNEPLSGQSGIGAHRDSIALPCLQTAMLCTAFSTLRVLQLSLWVPEVSFFGLGNLTNSLVNLLSTMPKLEELHLGLQRVLLTPELGEEIGSATFSTALKLVHVIGGCMWEEHVYLFLRNHRKSIEQLTLEKVTLEGGREMLLERLDGQDFSYTGRGLSLRLEDVQDGLTGSRVSELYQLSVFQSHLRF